MRGQADCVALARAFLDDARWVWHAAERLGASVWMPPQYARVSRTQWPGAAMVRPALGAIALDAGRVGIGRNLRRIGAIRLRYCAPCAKSVRG